MARKSNRLSTEDVKAKKKKFENVANNLEIVPTSKFLKDNFLPYAWSFTLDRALVDVTGLKPVQRRILYTMYKEGLSPNAKRSKVASLVGSVLHFHPHGDSSVEDALKNLAREHIFRVPLIDGKGDFGVPGTPGAAGRYIEAKLNKGAWLNVEEIAENATRMMDSYDGSKKEPVQIPVRWPISVINGGAGIAIAYASSMPSHNPTEIMKACKMLVRNENTTHAALQKVILGPDFNMGGVITANDGIKDYLETGQGSFKVRGQYEVIPGARSSFRIEFDEIPFGTYPEKIIQEIQKKVEAGHLKEISSYKDLSDLKHPIRVVVETKPSVNYKQVLQDLFKHTSLEASFSANITTIVNNKPQLSSMKELLLDFIAFRKLCIGRKMSHALKKKDERLHIVEGMLLALLDIDSAIKIIRGSDDIKTANEKLQKKLKIDEVQAEYVLALQLRRLTKMDKLDLENERKGLIEEITYIQKLLTDPETQKEYLLKEFDETLKVIGDERKTIINSQSVEEFLETEKEVVQELKKTEKNLPCYITRFADGKILKSSEPYQYAAASKKFINTPIIEQLKMNTQDNIVIVDNLGTGYKIPLSYLIEDKVSNAKDMGIVLPKGATIAGVAKCEFAEGDTGIAIGTKNGSVKVVKNDYSRGETFPMITLDEDDTIVSARFISTPIENTDFVFISSGGYILRFPASAIRVAGSKSSGVRGMKLKEGDSVVHFTSITTDKADEAMILTQAEKSIKRSSLSEVPAKGKSGIGVQVHLFKRDEQKLINAYVGINPVASLDKFKNAVQMPAMIKRASRGEDFDYKVLFGTNEIIN